jgi:hypothetical protein
LLVGDILVSEELSSNLKIQAARMLQYLVQTSSTINVLRFCPEHPVMEYLLLLGKQRTPEPAELLEALKLVTPVILPVLLLTVSFVPFLQICNACNSASGCSWVTDETEWNEGDEASHKTSNVMTAVQFCAWCLGKPLKEVQETAAKLAFNLSVSDISDHLAVIVCESLVKLLAQPGVLADGTVAPALAALLAFVDLSAQAC